MARVVNVGVMGLGGNGRAHLKNYQKHPNARVVAVCDANEPLTRRVAEEHGVEKAYDEVAAYHSSEWSQAEIYDQLRREVYRLAELVPSQLTVWRPASRCSSTKVATFCPMTL